MSDLGSSFIALVILLTLAYFLGRHLVQEFENIHNYIK